MPMPPREAAPADQNARVPGKSVKAAWLPVAPCVLETITAYLNKQENRRLDAFQARCLRKILRIPHSYISRVPNAVVLQRSGARLLSNSLLRKQLTFLGHVARKPGDDAVRLTVFQPFSHLLAEPPENRKRGRPRKTWPQEIYRHACAAAGGVEALPALLRNTAQSATAWLSAVHTYCDAV